MRTERVFEEQILSIPMIKSQWKLFKVFIVIFIEEYENLFLKHSSCPAIFLRLFLKFYKKILIGNLPLFFSVKTKGEFRNKQSNRRTVPGFVINAQKDAFSMQENRIRF